MIINKMRQVVFTLFRRHQGPFYQQLTNPKKQLVGPVVPLKTNIGPADSRQFYFIYCRKIKHFLFKLCLVSFVHILLTQQQQNC